MLGLVITLSAIGYFYSQVRNQPMQASNSPGTAFGTNTYPYKSAQAQSPDRYKPVQFGSTGKHQTYLSQARGFDYRQEEHSRNRSRLPMVGTTITIPKSKDGHFWTDARVNHRNVHFLVDTGASLISLTMQDARRAGVVPRHHEFTALVSTAAGPARAARIRLKEVRIGHAKLQDVEAVVIEKGLSHSLLGMSWLGEMKKLEATKNQLIIHP